MTTSYKETVAPVDDVKSAVLSALAEDRPWVFIQVHESEDDSFFLKLDVGCGITSSAMTVALLAHALRVMPMTPEAKRDLAAQLMRSANEAEGYEVG